MCWRHGHLSECVGYSSQYNEENVKILTATINMIIIIIISTNVIKTEGNVLHICLHPVQPQT